MSTTSITTQLDRQRRKVDFDTYDVLVQQLIAMVESRQIEVAPVFQRKFRWDKLRRSELIESVFLGVPVPSLFMATNKDGTWELVDGVQRISTLVQFAGAPEARRQLDISEPLTIDGIRKLSSLNGLDFDRIPESLKLHFRTRPIKVITLSDKSDTIVRFDLFERLNKGGISLTSQEIRSCVYRGRFAHFIDEMADNQDFRMVVNLKASQDDDGTKEECVLRFFSFLHRYKDFEHSVVDFLNDYMEIASKEFKYGTGKAIFARTFQELSRILPSGIVRGNGRKITPINLFEAVSVGAALALSRQSNLGDRPVQEWINSPRLRRLTTGATNSRRMVVGRIEYCQDHFLSE